MRLYAAVAAGGFRRYATYRAATAAGVFTNTVFGFILAYTYIALWDERPHLGGYDQVAGADLRLDRARRCSRRCAMMGGGFEDELMERIRTGDIAVDLYRPGRPPAVVAGRGPGPGGVPAAGARGGADGCAGALAFDLALPGSTR